LDDVATNKASRAGYYDSGHMCVQFLNVER
ncbi:MAG: hypothetical protein RLZZ495_1282, partial [Pseudomonadota bacterium]